MKVLILGAGVVGVTSAFYLSRAGHEVTVVDRKAGAGEDTSFGNSGQVSPGYSAPWSGPGLPLLALKWILTEKHSPLIIRPTLDIWMYSWLIKLLQNCTAEHYARNKGRMVRLAEYSRDCLGRLRAETGIAYDERTRGTLQLLRTQQQVDAVSRDIEVLERFGVTYQQLDRSGCVAVEPALFFTKEKIAGGLRLPNDETGDCHIFTKRLAEIATAAGVTFRYSTTVRKLVAEDGKITKVIADGAELASDIVVVSMGSYSPLLLRPIGLSIPVYPVKGYSITLPIENSVAAPVSTVMDETYKIAITRLGDRIRAGGRAEITGYDRTLRLSRRAALDHSVGDLFPRGGDLSKASFWTGLRPMTPDGTPVIGPTKYSNLYLNTGHGTLGWTMSCGSGRVLADMISGRKPDIETADLAMSRYG